MLESSQGQIIMRFEAMIMSLFFFIASKNSSEESAKRRNQKF